MEPYGTTSVSKRDGLDVTITIRIIMYACVRHPQDRPHATCFRAKSWDVKDGPEQSRYDIGVCVGQRETDHAQAGINVHIAPEVGRVDCQKRRLMLLTQQDGNRIIRDDGVRTQIGDEENRTTIPVCQSSVQIPSEEVFIQD